MIYCIVNSKRRITVINKFDLLHVLIWSFFSHLSSILSYCTNWTRSESTRKTVNKATKSPFYIWCLERLSVLKSQGGHRGSFNFRNGKSAIIWSSLVSRLCILRPLQICYLERGGQRLLGYPAVWAFLILMKYWKRQVSYKLICSWHRSLIDALKSKQFILFLL